MNIDITSFFFNSTIEGATATCAWGTSIGQSKTKECRIETETIGVNDIVTGLVYKSKTDVENFDLSKGSKNREYLIYSIFDKVYVNGINIPNASYIVLLAREKTASHNGRLIVSYPPYAKYSSTEVVISNEETIKKMFDVLGCTKDGCWFAYDISVINQDELHFSCVVVDKDKNTVYRGKSSDRSAEWSSLIPDSGHRIKAIKDSESEKNQIIYYGAPGTGKSHKIKAILEEEKVPKQNIFRTTFHPDSDYSTFVGAYKPKMKKYHRYDGKGFATFPLDDDLAKAKAGENIIDKVIEYEFVPQAFLKAYVRAYQVPDEKVYLVIEEINRGNCAQIFGDLFQLLDRDGNGKSDYTIKADDDLKTYLEDEFKKLGVGDEGIKDGELCLPSNLYIYATMNTSDQSLFPIDSAFKRRWDWEYEPIKYKNTDWTIKIDDDHQYSWVEFQNEVNYRILSDTSSEDKMLGDYFVNPSDGVITKGMLLNKILFYLWNDVCKDGEGDIFKTGGNDEVTFSDLYRDDKKLIAMMDYLKSEYDRRNPSKSSPSTDTDTEPTTDTETPTE